MRCSSVINFFALSNAYSESIDSFAVALRLRAKDCAFGDQTESLIRIVFGCVDARVKEPLLCEDNLTLQLALDVCRAAEASKAQMKAMKNDSFPPTSVAIAASGGRPPSDDPCCRQCSNPPHETAERTRQCGKTMRHYARMCHSRLRHSNNCNRSRHTSHVVVAASECDTEAAVIVTPQRT